MTNLFFIWAIFKTKRHILQSNIGSPSSIVSSALWMSKCDFFQTTLSVWAPAAAAARPPLAFLAFALFEDSLLISNLTALRVPRLLELEAAAIRFVSSSSEIRCSVEEFLVVLPGKE